MSASPESSNFHGYICHDCGSQVGFRSRRRNVLERFFLPLVLLQPVRFGECFRRDYRLIFTAVRDRLSEIRKIPPAKQPVAANRNVA